MFAPATKEKSKLRLALLGPAGGGKTFSALAIASGLGKKIAVIDTERGSARLYAGEFKFDVVEPKSFESEFLISAIVEAENAGYDVLIIDSFSHAWAGTGGILQFVDKLKSGGGNEFAPWSKATPKQNALLDAMLQSKIHIIVTMRTKTDYVLEENDKGKKVPKKVGMAPVQRDGIEYEFTVTCDITQDHVLIVGKTRCPIIDGAIVEKPGAAFGKTLLDWLNDGKAAPKQEAAPKEKQKEQASPAATAVEEPKNLTTAGATTDPKDAPGAEQAVQDSTGESAKTAVAQDATPSQDTATATPDQDRQRPATQAEIKGLKELVAAKKWDIKDANKLFAEFGLTAGGVVTFDLLQKVAKHVSTNPK